MYQCNLSENSSLEFSDGTTIVNDDSGGVTDYDFVKDDTISFKITAIVDYAHTPDALKNVLETINSIRTKNEELITVVGCGGDRDKSKRPIMAHIASALSTKVIFTSDNPRSEIPETI